MSTELYSTTGEAAENDATPQTATVGGNKPLHRFIRGQPKVVGIIVVILGTSLFTVSMAINVRTVVHYTLTAVQTGFLLGSLFLISGIMYILAEHNPTKKTVTISLALSVVTLLMAWWNSLHMIMDFLDSGDNTTESDDTYWYSHSEAIGFSVAVIFTFYTAAGIVIFTVMSALAGAALRSTKSQAVIRMTAAPTQGPVEGAGSQEGAAKPREDGSVSPE